MLTIRFARMGKRNKAQFKIMLQEHTVAPGGRHVEVLGSHDPHLKKTVLKEERIKYWLSQGVKMSDTVYNLLVANGLVSGEKRKVKLPAKKVEFASPAGEGVKAAETSATEEAKAEEVKKEEAKAEEAPVEEKK